MKIYIAGKFECRGYLRNIRDTLGELNYTVTSSWLDEGPKPEHISESDFYKKLILADLRDIAAADCIIFDTTQISERGGREVEFGYALQFVDKLLLMVGPNRTHFHVMVDKQFDSWSQVIQYLNGFYPVIKVPTSLEKGQAGL